MMNDDMIVTMTRSDLYDLMQRAAKAGALEAIKHAEASREQVIGKQAIAAVMGISQRTLDRRLRSGQLNGIVRHNGRRLVATRCDIEIIDF